jgi:uncharacterized membrane protein YphA (DoxX/SURF4 family)
MPATYYLIKEKYLDLLRLSIGFIYLLFGALKFFPGSSPAEDVAVKTIHYLTAGYLTSGTSLFLLAFLESALGLLIIVCLIPRLVLIILVFHMIGTLTPLILLTPGIISSDKIGLTLLGQYILKNFILLAAMILLLKAKKQP